MERISVDEYNMNFAKNAALRSTCLSSKKGAVIVKNGFVIATGYNGAPSRTISCDTEGVCLKKSLGYKSGEGHHVCRAVHAEANAIIMAAKLGISVDGATMYCTHRPCENCAKLIINSGIKEIVYNEDYNTTFDNKLYNEANVLIRQYPG